MAKSKQQERVTNYALQEAIAPIGLEFTRNSVIIGENHCRIYGITRYPGDVDYGWYFKLTNIPGTIVNISFNPIDNNEFVSSLSRSAGQFRGTVNSTKDSQTRIHAEKAAQDAEKLIAQIDQSGEIVGLYSTTIMVLSRDEEDFNKKCRRVESIINSMKCKVRVLSNLQKEAYQHICPNYINSKDVNEICDRIMPMSTFVGGFPFAAAGFSDNKGYYLGKDSEGGIIIIDLWKRDNNRPNSNITVLGNSGLGKSTAIKNILTSEFGQGTTILVIDPENEYKTLCMRFGGDYINAAGGKLGRINPLQIRPAPDDDNDNTNDLNCLFDTKDGLSDMAKHMKVLEIFFNLYIPSLSDKHIAILKSVLVELYKRFNIEWDTDISAFKNTDFPTFSDLHSLIKDKSEKEQRNKEIYDDLSLYLEDATNGSDSFLWNGHTSIKANSKFICLDTNALQNTSDNVKRAQYFNILSWCWEQMSKRNEKVLLVADEAWLLIDDKVPQSLAFLRNVEKRARKYEAAVAVITQSIVDFIDPSVKMYGQAVLDMPAIKILFGTDGQSLKETKEIFNLTEAQYELVASCRRREALVRIGSQPIRVKFEFSEERLALFGKEGGR